MRGQSIQILNYKPNSHHIDRTTKQPSDLNHRSATPHLREAFFDHTGILLEGKKTLKAKTAANWYEVKFPSQAGLYQITHSTDGLVYIGESTNIHARWKTHGTDTRFSALRRHIGTDLLSFQLKTKSELGQVTKAKTDKRMHFTDQEDLFVKEYLENCTVKFLPIRFGRIELEEHLIHNLQPLLNRKSKA